MDKPTIKFGGREVEADVRMLYDMKKVLFDKKWLRETENKPLYYMYRDLYLEKDKERIRENNLRFDITVIPPALLGLEYNKTKGHYHSLATENFTYPELYGVIKGRAHYLLQKQEKGKLKDVVLIKAEEGDKVIIPPNYGHITINPSSEVLKMANWVSPDVKSSYEEIEEKEGGAYFETRKGFIKNDKYEEIPDLRKEKAKSVPDFNLTPEVSMYKLVEDMEYLRFLNYPEKFEWLFEKLL